MVYRTLIVVAALVLRFGRVIADWDANPEGATNSGIKTVDTDEGFNVTDSGGASFPVGYPPSAPSLLDSSKCKRQVRMGQHAGQYLPFLSFLALAACIVPSILLINFMFHIGNFTVLTSYKYNKCSSDQMKTLKQAVSDANTIAYAGIKVTALPEGRTVDWIDFRDEAAIDYFGPPSKNGGQQSKIYSKSIVKEEQDIEPY